MIFSSQTSDSLESKRKKYIKENRKIYEKRNNCMEKSLYSINYS